MKKSFSVLIALFLSVFNFSMVFSGQYAVVRGWEIYQDHRGCTALHPSTGSVSWTILVAPAGGWELRFTDLAGHNNDKEFPARIFVDNREFNDTYFTLDGMFIGLLPLEQRIAMAKGNQVVFVFEEMELPFSLQGATAAMLKMEECWHRMTGYNPAISSKAGSYAFK